jgi:hypothetical protein
MKKSQPNPSQQLSDALATYCQQKYPGKTLSIFNDPSSMDPKDYNLCACNMNDVYYTSFLESLDRMFPGLKASLGSIRAQCLLPACSISSFKKTGLDNCPVPQCLEIANIDDSNIAGNVTVNQNANCKQYGITPQPPSPPGPSPGPMPPGPIPPGPAVSPWDKYKILIIISIVAVILIIIIIILLITQKKKLIKKK